MRWGRRARRDGVIVIRMWIIARPSVSRRWLAKGAGAHPDAIPLSGLGQTRHVFGDAWGLMPEIFGDLTKNFLKVNIPSGQINHELPPP
jgi:hypothetical protein